MTSLRISGAEEVLSTREEMLERFESNASGLLDWGNALTSFELGLANLAVKLDLVVQSPVCTRF